MRGQPLDGLAADLGDALVSLDRPVAGRPRVGVTPRPSASHREYARGRGRLGRPRRPGALPTIAGQMTLCALCRRNLLAGERFRYWQSVEERQVARVVCHLCEPTATRDGWARTERARARERRRAARDRSARRLAAQAASSRAPRRRQAASGWRRATAAQTESASRRADQRRARPRGAWRPPPRRSRARSGGRRAGERSQAPASASRRASRRRSVRSCRARSSIRSRLSMVRRGADATGPRGVAFRGRLQFLYRPVIEVSCREKIVLYECGESWSWSWSRAWR